MLVPKLITTLKSYSRQQFLARLGGAALDRARSLIQQG
jgi:hypothetical protein